MERARKKYAKEMARNVLKTCEIIKPWVNLEVILAKKGYHYLEVDTFLDDIDAIFLTKDGVTYAAVNAKHHPHRRRFSLAHEFGHILMNHKLSYYKSDISLDNPPSNKDHTYTEKFFEQEANTFAGELLVPFEMLEKKFKETQDLKELSKIFLVSPHVLSIAIQNNANRLYK